MTPVTTNDLWIAVSMPIVFNALVVVAAFGLTSRRLSKIERRLAIIESLMDVLAGELTAIKNRLAEVSNRLP